MGFARSFAIRRHRPSPAKVRSTTRRRGMSSKPGAGSDRLTIRNVPRQSALQPGAGMAAIRKDMAQQRIGGVDGTQHSRCRVPVLDIRPVNDDANQKSACIGDDVTFAPLAGITAPAPFRDFHALAVDHTRRRVDRAA